jgi:hypothetical protein
MNTPAAVVFGMTELMFDGYNQSNRYLYGYFKIICESNNIFKMCMSQELNSGDECKYLSVNKTMLQEVLNKCSLLELKEYLSLLIPIASNCTYNTEGEDHMSTKNLALAIKYIDGEIAGEISNNKQLIITNQQLRSQNDMLNSETVGLMLKMRDLQEACRKLREEKGKLEVTKNNQT